MANFDVIWQSQDISFLVSSCISMKGFLCLLAHWRTIDMPYSTFKLALELKKKKAFF